MKKNVIPDSSKVLATIKNNNNNYPMKPPYIPSTTPDKGYTVTPGAPIGGTMPPGEMQPGPPSSVVVPPVMNKNYLQGYLRQFIGKYIRVDFLVGTGSFIDREGILTNVGIDYIELQEVQTGNSLVCDFYSIKFVTVYTNY